MAARLAARLAAVLATVLAHRELTPPAIAWKSPSPHPVYLSS
jgi:hypothetical protein